MSQNQLEKNNSLPIEENNLHNLYSTTKTMNVRIIEIQFFFM